MMPIQASHYRRPQSQITNYGVIVRLVLLPAAAAPTQHQYSWDRIQHAWDP